MKLSLLLCSLVCSAASVSWAQLAGPLNFEVAGQLAANFRATANPTTASEASDGTNGYVNVVGPAGGTPWIGVYDTTPASGTDPSPTFPGIFTAHLDISAANSGSSFGIFLFDDSTSTDAGRSANNLLALLNLDTTTGGTGSEQIRFWRDTVITGSAVSNQYTTSAFTGTNGTYDTGTNSWVTTAANAGNETIDTTAPFTFYLLDFTYNPVALTLQVSTGNFSATLSIPPADVIVNPGIALRINDLVTGDTNSTKFDNFRLTVVPEPGTAGLLGVGGLIALLRRRSRAAR